eukprot:m.136291 g.136291  ORF g.136291 m.136291 type:complete len:345 (-) comp9551_c0_seq1:306-1340(-)
MPITRTAAEPAVARTWSLRRGVELLNDVTDRDGEGGCVCTVAQSVQGAEHLSGERAQAKRGQGLADGARVVDGGLPLVRIAGKAEELLDVGLNVAVRADLYVAVFLAVAHQGGGLHLRQREVLQRAQPRDDGPRRQCRKHDVALFLLCRRVHEAEPVGSQPNNCNRVRLLQRSVQERSEVRLLDERMGVALERGQQHVARCDGRAREGGRGQEAEHVDGLGQLHRERQLQAGERGRGGVQRDGRAQVPAAQRATVRGKVRRNQTINSAGRGRLGMGIDDEHVVNEAHSPTISRCSGDVRIGVLSGGAKTHDVQLVGASQHGGRGKGHGQLGEQHNLAGEICTKV